jgi:hypothetical protein
LIGILDATACVRSFRMTVFRLLLPAALAVAAPVVAQPIQTHTTSVRQPITITGCLQQGENGHGFILTHLNEPPISPATSRTAQPSTVTRDELREARNAYRLEPAAWLHLDKLLGTQVRVSGTLAEPAHLPAAGSVATSGVNPPTITESELAAVRVTGVTKVRKSCGTGSSGKQ